MTGGTTTGSGNGTPRIGAVVLPEYTWQRTRAIWQSLDRLGLDHAWSFDHHSWRSLRDEPWYDALSTLTAAAAVTDRIRLGTMVASPNFRHPAVLAKHVMTMDEISSGRIVLGIGAGAPGADARLLGTPDLSPSQRADRFAEFVELSDLLLRHPVTTYRGAYFDTVGARMIPGCVQRPRVPFAIAAAGRRGLELAARYGQCWVTIGDARQPGSRTEEESWKLLALQHSRLDEACERVGRAVPDIDRLVNVSRVVESPYASPERFLDVLGRCRELGFTDVVVNYPRTQGIFGGSRDAFETAVDAALASR
ncbi:LLM class flavin-dependent oxidoreductase [Streptomyces sp. TE33382]